MSGSEAKAGQNLVVLANFDEVFAPFQPLALGPRGRPAGLWQKAVLLASQPGYVLVAPGRPSSLDPLPPACYPPRAIVQPRRYGGELCRDILKEEAAWKQLLAGIDREQSTRVLAQVFSPGAEDFIGRLLDVGVAVDTTDLPRVSGHTVSHWNSKVGGRELLQGIPAVADALAPSVVCSNRREVETVVAKANRSRALVVKANRSMGGAGLWIFPAGSACSEAAVNERLGTAPRPGKQGTRGYNPSSMPEPYLVEEMAGELGANVSPTADFQIQPNGSVLLLGLGEQVLDDGVAYRGCRYPLRATSSQTGNCESLGRAICCELWARGYRGFANIDFVALADGTVRVIEINLRQSAPLDQFLIMRRHFGDGWADHKAFACMEGIVLRNSESAIEIAGQLLKTAATSRQATLLCLLAIHAAEADRRPTASVFSAADNLGVAQQQLEKARTYLLPGAA
ncbi:MAG: hypothetical protein M1389_14390 [Chloroflexi bacterium]|nr:hypothetical protein [Chloroflexota bacterium]